MSIRSFGASALCIAGALFPVAANAAYDAAGAYTLRCSSCHGDKGQGTKGVSPTLGPALKANPFIVAGSADAIKNIIRKGRGGKKRLYNESYPNMPAFGAEFVSDIDAMVAYLKGDMQK